jgi:Bacteriocin-protection, YdeI or OmpD-Associated/Domain of unknown function (DUF1905)
MAISQTRRMLMSKQVLRFKTRIEGREAGVVAAIAPPVDVVEFFGTRARVPVRGTINGFPYRSSLMPCGPQRLRMMPVNKILCSGAGVQPGDMVNVVMERDQEERTVDPPPALKKAMAQSKAAKENWEKLSFTHKKEMAASIKDAKKEETRTRRLAKVIQVLETGAKWTG